MIGVCAVICGVDDFVSMAEFARIKRELFARFLDLSAGIPSHDRFNAIFAAINLAEFERCMLSWIADHASDDFARVDMKRHITHERARA